jgi:hypothetical protein
VGRRGLAGTIVTYKVRCLNPLKFALLLTIPQIASALADEGASAKEVYDIAEYVATRLGTIGAGLEHCHVRERLVVIVVLTLSCYSRFQVLERMKLISATMKSRSAWGSITRVVF